GVECRRDRAGPVSCRFAGRGPDRRERVPAEFLFRTPRILPVVRPWHDLLASSGPELRSAKRSRRRGAPVPVGSPAGPPPLGPNDPIATPAPRRSRGDAPPPVTSPAVVVATRRYRPPSPEERSSNPAGRRIPAGRGSAK